MFAMNRSRESAPYRTRTVGTFRTQDLPVPNRTGAEREEAAGGFAAEAESESEEACYDLVFEVTGW